MLQKECPFNGRSEERMFEAGLYRDSANGLLRLAEALVRPIHVHLTLAVVDVDHLVRLNSNIHLGSLVSRDGPQQPLYRIILTSDRCEEGGRATTSAYIDRVRG